MGHFLAKIRVAPLQGGTKQNSLFCAGPNWQLNACVGWNGGPADFWRIATGYFEAGAIIANRLKADSLGVDRLIYPLVMNYRHGIECALKHLTIMLPAIFDDDVELMITHNVDNLWKVVRSYLERLHKVPDDLDQTQKTIHEFNELDPNGEDFRYPFATDGTRLLQTTTHINVDVFAERMDQLTESLSGYYEWVCALWDRKLDMDLAYMNYAP